MIKVVNLQGESVWSVWMPERVDKATVAVYVQRAKQFAKHVDGTVYALLRNVKKNIYRSKKIS